MSVHFARPLCAIPEDIRDRQQPVVLLGLSHINGQAARDFTRLNREVRAYRLAYTCYSLLTIRFSGYCWEEGCDVKGPCHRTKSRESHSIARTNVQTVHRLRIAFVLCADRL